jgi:hypothetical protein
MHTYRMATLCSRVVNRVQEYDVLVVFKGNDYVVQVIGYDSGYRGPDLPRVPPMLYMELLQGRTLRDVMNQWITVCHFKLLP